MNREIFQCSAPVFLNIFCFVRNSKIAAIFSDIGAWCNLKLAITKPSIHIGPNHVDIEQNQRETSM